MRKEPCVAMESSFRDRVIVDVKVAEANHRRVYLGASQVADSLSVIILTMVTSLKVRIGCRLSVSKSADLG